MSIGQAQFEGQIFKNKKRLLLPYKEADKRYYQATD